jgi:hypothetical protein
MRQDELRDALRREAAAHRPDSAAMWGRVQQRTDRPGRAGRTGVRLVGVGAAVCAGLGLCVAGTFAAVGTYGKPEPVVSMASPAGSGAAPQLGAPTSRPRPSAGGHRSARPSGSPTGAATTPPGAGPTGGATASASASRADQPAQGFLWSDGSVDPASKDAWAQSDVTLKSRYTVTAVTVTLRISLTPGVANTGAWSSVPAADLDVRVEQQADALVYTWTLKPGVTLAPGSYEFAGQYDHASGGRDAGGDRYEATAVGHGQAVRVSGDFYPHS